MKARLYLVGTPIGNLGDFSPRALETLKSVDFIAAEDTRVSLKLLRHFKIKKPLISYHEHNKLTSGEAILEKLLNGESCALVSDAGMPCISDPGTELVALCHERGVEVVSVPGPSALISALSLSGFLSGSFVFEGFLPAKKGERKERLSALKPEKRTVIFYEAPHKLKNSLRDIFDVLGDRKISVSREITKLHEETLRGRVSDFISKYEEEQPRGEFVLVLAPAEAHEEEKMSEDEALKLVLSYRDQGLSLKEASKLASAESGYSKNELYSLATKK